MYTMRNVFIRYATEQAYALTTGPKNTRTKDQSKKTLQKILINYFSLLIIFSCSPFFVLSQCTSGCAQATSSNSMPASNNFSNTFCITTLSTLTYNQNFDMNGGTTCVGPNVTFSAGGGNWNGNWTVNNYGSFSRGITLNSGQIFYNYGTFTGSVSLNGGTIVNYNGAVFTPSSFNFNGGSFTNNSGGTASFSSSVTVNSGATFINNGTLTTTGLTLNSSANATLGGNTTINGSVTNNGTINIAGLITISGNYNQNSSGILASQSGSQCNALNVSGTIQGQGTYNGSNGLLLNKVLASPACTACLTNGASTTPPGAPVNQITAPTLTASANTISGTITNPGGSPAATHYIVLRRFGTAVSDQPADYINYTVGNTIGSSVVVAVNAISTLSFTDANVITGYGCGTYYYAVFPYNASGSCGTYNRTVSATNRSSIAVTSTGGTAGTGTAICSGSTSGVLTLTGYVGSVVRWESAVSPFSTWSTISNTTNTYTSGTLTQTTQFRAIVNAGTSCSNANAATATITVNAIPAAPAVTGASRCGNGSVTLTATPGTGETIDWYAASSGGTALLTGNSSYTTASLSATTTFYAEARNSSGGCISPTRTAVTATVNPSPSVTLASMPSICAGTTSITLAYSNPVNSPNEYSIDWSASANAAGMADVSWTTLSGGTIPVTGITSTAGSYAATILVRNSISGCQTDVSNTIVSCGTANEGGSITLTAPGASVFTAINFASYGLPNGSCGSFTIGSCHASNSVSVVQTAALGRNSFTITANNATFGDPCVTIGKRLYIEAVSNAAVLNVYAIPTITAASGTSRCGAGAVTLSATPSSGAAIDWYSTASGGTALATGSNTYTNPSLSSTTTYYAEARNTTAGCISVSRTAVTASIITIPVAPAATSNTRCGNGTVTLTATPGASQTIDWYAAATGGTALATGNTSFTTPVLAATTTYYAEARSTSTGCISATRTAVTATVNPSPSVTLSNFTAICAGTTSTTLTYSSPVNSPDQYSIDWSSTANAAGINDVSWSGLSGGIINITGLITTAGNYAANIYVRNSTTGCQTDVSNSGAVTCGTANENSSVTLTAPGSGVFTSISFASYGTPAGTCGSFTTGACHAATSLSVVQSAALGNNSFTLTANNVTFGDPCSGTVKRLYIEALSTIQVLTINAAPTTTGTTPAARCNPGTVTIAATPSAGATVDWYDAASGGSLLLSGNNSYTTPSISTTTAYYAAARNTTTGCIAGTRTPVDAIVGNYPSAPAATGNSHCGIGIVTLTATPGSGETIDWYAAASGGTALLSGNTSFTTGAIAATTIYYAEARNTTTGCVSAARTAVTATVNAAPSVTLSNFSTICSGTGNTTLTYSSPVNAPDQYYIGWSSAANAAGMSDVSWTALSGGTITVSGLTGTAGSYAATILVRNSVTGCQADVSNGSVVSCGTASEGGSVTLTAPAGGLFTAINFASYGLPNGSCGSYSIGSCHAGTSLSVVQTAGLNKNSFTVAASNGTFGDPCVTIGKRLYIEAVSNTQILTINAAPTITASAGATRCGTGTLTLSATPSGGAAIDWYAASTGGSALATGSNSYITPSISSTTLYYAQARNTSTGCTSIARTAVTATVTVPAISSFTPVNAGIGTTVIITGTNFTGATAVSFGGTAATSFTVNSGTQITAVVGAGSTGNVAVTTSCGTGTRSGFTYYAAPTISAFTPSSGYIGNTITITGTNFTGTTAVTIGGTAVASFTVVSSTSITAVLGTGTTGSVAVTTPGGTAAKTGFSYIQATIWTGSLNNSWNNAGNWNNGIPAAASLVIIPVVETYPAISASQSISGLIMDTATALSIPGSNTLTVTGNIVNNGTINGTGKISMGGSSAQTISGTGTVNNIAINNSAGVSISSGSNMVNITGTLTPTSGTLTTNGKLTLKSTASGTAMIGQGAAGGNYISGTVIFERYIPARRAWRLISYPFTSTAPPTINASIQEGAGGTAGSNPNPGYGTHITGGITGNGFDANPTGNPSMKELSGTNWVGISSTNQPITSKTGYFIFVRGSRANNLSAGTGATADNTTLRGIGNIRQGNQSITLNGSGWQLTGNPFASPVDLNAMATTNSALINSNFKFWDPKLGGSNNVGGYVTASYNGSGYDYAPAPASSISEFVQSGAAFFVDSKGAGTLAVNENHKAGGGSDNVFRPSGTQSKLHINLRSVNSDGTQPVVDGVMIGYDENFDDAINGMDAAKLPSNTNENLSVKKGGQLLSIERRKQFTTADTIYLNMNYLKVKSYQLELNAAAFDAGSLTAYLEDAETGTSTPLNLTGSTLYGFSINMNSNVNRFKIVFRKMIVLPVTLTSITAIRQGNNIAVQWKVQNEINLAHYDIERSDDGIRFTKAGEQTAGNSSATAYNWIDADPNNGMNYYRIKMIDRDGQFRYSTVVHISFNKNGMITIYPNPIENNTVQLLMAGQTKGKYQVNIFNSNGQTVSSNEFNFNGTDVVKTVAVPIALSKGIYHAEITGTSGSKTSLRFSVQ